MNINFIYVYCIVYRICVLFCPSSIIRNERSVTSFSVRKKAAEQIRPQNTTVYQLQVYHNNKTTEHYNTIE
jgi:hypothetical protein